jgi:hypothetical protein
LDNIESILAKMEACNQHETPLYARYSELRASYLERRRPAQIRVHDNDENYGEDVERFEKYYFDCLLDCVRDILQLLVAFGALTDSEIAPYLESAERVAP